MANSTFSVTRFTQVTHSYLRMSELSKSSYEILLRSQKSNHRSNYTFFNNSSTKGRRSVYASFVRPSVRSFVRSLFRSFFLSFVRSFICAFGHSFVRSSTSSYFSSFVLSSARTFVLPFVIRELGRSSVQAFFPLVRFVWVRSVGRLVAWSCFRLNYSFT